MKAKKNAKTKVKTKVKTKTKRKDKKEVIKIPTRKIPKNKLENALRIINDSEDPLWLDRNASCNIAVHTELGSPDPLEVTKIKYARLCLIRRDWRNLAKVLMVSNLYITKPTVLYVALFTKYAAICLAHKDTALFETFLKSVISYGERDTTIKKCTEYPIMA